MYYEPESRSLVARCVGGPAFDFGQDLPAARRASPVRLHVVQTC